jgi:hypothetical protein
MSDAAQSLPPAALVVTHPVANFDSWKVGFDDHEPARKANGFLGHHLNRAQDDPNLVSIYLAVADIDQARAFSTSDELRDIMQEVGVTGPPEMTWVTPVREAIVWDRELPGFLLSHTVADFDAWLEGYDGADALRKSDGIIGHAANRSIDDPSLAVVYHQAETFEDLRGFLADPELKAVMENAGVTSEPEVIFATGGWAKMY